MLASYTSNIALAYKGGSYESCQDFFVLATICGGKHRILFCPEMGEVGANILPYSIRRE